LDKLPNATGNNQTSLRMNYLIVFFFVRKKKMFDYSDFDYEEEEEEDERID
jgi:hypothetical protein